MNVRSELVEAVAVSLVEIDYSYFASSVIQLVGLLTDWFVEGPVVAT